MGVFFKKVRHEGINNVQGGSPFEDYRNAPYVLVGLKIRHGSNIDAVTPIYRKINDDGSLSEITFPGMRHGGGGGGETILEKAGCVVVGLDLRQGKITDKIRVAFQKWTNKGVDVNSPYQYEGPVGGNGGGDETIYVKVLRVCSMEIPPQHKLRLELYRASLIKYYVE